MCLLGSGEGQMMVRGSGEFQVNVSEMSGERKISIWAWHWWTWNLFNLHIDTISLNYYWWCYQTHHESKILTFESCSLFWVSILHTLFVKLWHNLKPQSFFFPLTTKTLGTTNFYDTRYKIDKRQYYELVIIEGSLV